MPYKDLAKRAEMARIYSARYRARNLEGNREYQREWRRKWRENPENLKQHSETMAVYRKQHPERVKETQRVADKKRMHYPSRIASQYKYRREHPEVTAAGFKRWRERNPEKFILMMRLHGHRRYVRQCNAKGTHTLEQWLQRVHFYGWHCAYCNKELSVKTLRKDHIKPLIAGGLDWPANLAPACGSCNSRKSRKRWLPTNFAHRMAA